MTTLRDLVPEDLDLLVVWRNSPIVHDFVSNRLRTLEEAKAWYQRLKEYPKAWLKLILVNKSAVGYAVIEPIQEENRSCELAVVVGVPSLWGGGVGMTVMKEMLHYAFKEMGMRRVLVAVGRGNSRSERMIQQLNFRPDWTKTNSPQVTGASDQLEYYSLSEGDYRE